MGRARSPKRPARPARAERGDGGDEREQREVPALPAPDAAGEDAPDDDTNDMGGARGFTGFGGLGALGAIRGQVAQVTAPGEVVLNKGKDDGILLGMQFSVRAATSERVTDPATGADLGPLTREVCRIDIVEVADRTSVGRVYRWMSGGAIERSPLRRGDEVEQIRMV